MFEIIHQAVSLISSLIHKPLLPHLVHALGRHLQHTRLTRLNPRILLIKLPLKERLLPQNITPTNHIGDALTVWGESLVGEFYYDCAEQHEEDTMHFTPPPIQQIPLIKPHNLKISTHQFHSVPADAGQYSVVQADPFYV